MIKSTVLNGTFFIKEIAIWLVRYGIAKKYSPFAFLQEGRWVKYKVLLFFRVQLLRMNVYSNSFFIFVSSEILKHLSPEIIR